MPATTGASVVEVDGRRRVSLSKVGRPEDTRYLVRAEPDGTIVLTPAVVISALEARVLAQPELVERIEQALESDEEETVERHPFP